MAELEVLVRTAVFKSANALVGWLLQQTLERVEAAYQPKAGEVYKGRETLNVQCIFGHFELQRAYYHDAKHGGGHHPADAALGLEGSYTPALAKLICLEGADEQTYLKAERHLEQTGGIAVSARQIQRVVQRVGRAARQWKERPLTPGGCEHGEVPVMYVSADGTGVPMVAEELAGRAGKQTSRRQSQTPSGLSQIAFRKAEAERIKKGRLLYSQHPPWRILPIGALLDHSFDDCREIHERAQVLRRITVSDSTLIPREDFTGRDNSYHPQLDLPG